MSVHHAIVVMVVFQLLMLSFFGVILPGGLTISTIDTVTGCNTEFWGVIVGIADYQGRKNDLPVTSLHLQMLYDSLLHSLNWKTDHLRFLINEDATYENILCALDWLANQTDDNDVVLFSFQGHGSAVEDIDGDEEDGFDEGIVAWEGLSGLITDDVLDMKFDQIQCQGMFLVIHACLSGGLIDVAGQQHHFSNEVQQDINDDNRVILLSSRDQGLALAFPSLTRQLSWGLAGRAEDDAPDDQGYGVITAEEAAVYAKTKINRLFLGLLIVFPPAIISIIISEFITKMVRGYWIIPFPLIYDSFPGELPIYFSENP